jgi:hypothetical protein
MNYPAFQLTFGIIRLWDIQAAYTGLLFHEGPYTKYNVTWIID